MYALKRTDQGYGYVSKPGSKSSYTHSLANAKLFETKELAEADRCKGNEVIVDVSSYYSTFHN